MEGGSDAPRPRPDPAEELGRVRVRRRDCQLELWFDGRFTRADVDVVKSIPRRVWHARECRWSFPHTPESLSELTRSFGSRLVLPETLRGGDIAPCGGPAPRESTEPSRTSWPRKIENRTGDSVIDSLRRTIRIREYSRKMELAYVGWARRFFAFDAGEAGGPANLAPAHARAFLEHLAVGPRLPARSRNQAASALRFLFKDVLGSDEFVDVARAKNPQRVPTVLSHREVLRILRELQGKYFLIGMLLYSAGLRLEECLRTRVKDIDFELRQILVRDGKGRKDRYTPLAKRSADIVRAQIKRVAELHEKDRAEGQGWAPLPGALHRKDPNAGYELKWQFLFPATTINRDPATGRAGRWTLHPTACSARSTSRPQIRHPEACDMPHLSSLIRHGGTARRL